MRFRYEGDNGDGYRFAVLEYREENEKENAVANELYEECKDRDVSLFGDFDVTIMMIVVYDRDDYEDVRESYKAIKASHKSK